MSIDRLKRVNELLRREIAEVLFRVVSDAEVDLSSVTITRVAASRNLRHARVMVSIRDHTAERQAILARIRSHRSEIQQDINRKLSLKYTPRLSFELDTSLERGDRVLGLLYEIEKGLPTTDAANTETTEEET